jgi:hypothetical protein
MGVRRIWDAQTTLAKVLLSLNLVVGLAGVVAIPVTLHGNVWSWVIVAEILAIEAVLAFAASRMVKSRRVCSPPTSQER